MTTTNNLKPIEDTIDAWATNLLGAIIEWKATYRADEQKMFKAWKESGKRGMEFWYSDQCIAHRDRFGTYGHAALHEGICSAEEKIRKDGAKKLANVVKKCETIGGIKDAQWLHVGGKCGEVEGWIIGNDGRWLHIQTILAGGYNIQCLHLRFLCKIVKKH